MLGTTAYRPDRVAATAVAKGLSDRELQDLLSLARGADSVELKLAVPETHHRSTVAALGMDPLAAQIRQVFFLDTPDLTLDSSGLVVRARRVQGRDADSVVKLRPVVPEELPKKLRKSPDLVVEVDAMPGGYVCSATLKRQFAKVDVREAVAGDVPCASCSPRSNGASTKSTHRRASSWTT
jgi:hypothetical protein